MKKRKFAIVIFIITILILNTSSLALADNFKIKILDPGILPDSPDYESKQIQEKKKMETFTDSLEKVGYYLELAERRMVEAMFMEEKGKHQFVDELIRRYDENLTQALQYLAEGQSKEREDFNETIATIRTSTRIRMDELTFLLDQVPEVDRPTIELAIDHSRIVSNISVTELEQITADKLSTGAPEKVKTGPKEEPPGLSKQEEKEKFTGPPETPPGLADQDKDTGAPEEAPGLSKQEEKEKDQEKDTGSQKEPPGQLKKDAQDEKVKEPGPQAEPPGLSKQEEKDTDTGPDETPPGLSGKDKETGPPE